MKLSSSLLCSIAAGAAVLTVSCKEQKSTASLPAGTVHFPDSVSQPKEVKDSFPGPVPVDDTAKTTQWTCYTCGMG